MGIQLIYRLTNPELFGGWYARIEDWGSLHYVYIYTSRDRLFCTFPVKSLQSAKIQVTKELGKKGAKWEVSSPINKLNLYSEKILCK